MPYLPPRTINDTGLPTAYTPNKDLALNSKLLIELWRKFYPTIAYHMIDLSIKKAVDDVAGDLPHTIIDDLYGEAIPQTAEHRGWHQPHAQDDAGDALDATIGKKYKPAINVNAQVQIASRNRELGDFGIKDDKDIQVTIPTPLLDILKITVRIGDIIDFDGEEFEVTDWSRESYWKNTNVFLQIEIAGKRREIGS